MSFLVSPVDVSPCSVQSTPYCPSHVFSHDNALPRTPATAGFPYGLAFATVFVFLHGGCYFGATLTLTVRLGVFCHDNAPMDMPPQDKLSGSPADLLKQTGAQLQTQVKVIGARAEKHTGKFLKGSLAAYKRLQDNVIDVLTVATEGGRTVQQSPDEEVGIIVEKSAGVGVADLAEGQENQDLAGCVSEADNKEAEDTTAQSTLLGHGKTYRSSEKDLAGIERIDVTDGKEGEKRDGEEEEEEGKGQQTVETPEQQHHHQYHQHEQEPEAIIPASQQRQRNSLSDRMSELVLRAQQAQEKRFGWAGVTSTTAAPVERCAAFDERSQISNQSNGNEEGQREVRDATREVVQAGTSSTSTASSASDKASFVAPGNVTLGQSGKKMWPAMGAVIDAAVAVVDDSLGDILSL